MDPAHAVSSAAGLWTAKDDASYLSPPVRTPGYRHTVGIARVWHFINIHGFILMGVFYFTMLFISKHWRRLCDMTDNACHFGINSMQTALPKINSWARPDARSRTNLRHAL